MFEMLGMTDEEINAKFGFLVDAYKYGAPPHGGAGIGLDRLAMLMCGCDSLRDVTGLPEGSERKRADERGSLHCKRGAA